MLSIRLDRWCVKFVCVVLLCTCDVTHVQAQVIKPTDVARHDLHSPAYMKVCTIQGVVRLVSGGYVLATRYKICVGFMANQDVSAYTILILQEQNVSTFQFKDI